MKNTALCHIAIAVACCFGCSERGNSLGPVANVNRALEIRKVLGGSDAAGGGVAAAAATATGWATLSGRFIFEGNPPPPRPKQNVSIKPEEQAVCAPDGPPLERDLMVGEGGGLQNVVIYARNAAPVHESRQAPPEEPFIFDQKNCVFLSHVFAVQVQQPVVLQNSDPVSHNAKIEGRSGANQLIPANASLDYAFKVEEAVPQPISCSIHPWMRAYAIARKDAYFAVTGPDGSFTIADLPAGVELELQVWHERGTGTGGGLALDTPEAKELKWNARGRFRLQLEADTPREMVINVPPAALGLAGAG